jgi:hypothetical protein
VLGQTEEDDPGDPQRLHGGRFTHRLVDGEMEASRQGADLDLKSPVEFRAYIVAELAKWAKVVKDAGVKPE